MSQNVWYLVNNVEIYDKAGPNVNIYDFYIIRETCVSLREAELVRSEVADPPTPRLTQPASQSSATENPLGQKHC